MSSRPFRYAIPAGLLLAILAGCTDTPPPLDPILEPPPVEPPVQPPVQPPAPPPPPPTPLGALSAVYARIESHSYPAGAISYFLLAGDGTFSMRYSTLPERPGGYKGRYARADSEITFDFDGGSTAGPWQARGVLRGDTLAVSFNDIMLLSDFEDGRYVAPSLTSQISGYIHILDPITQALTPVSRGNWPAWSPDGRRIAFHREGHVYVVAADGSNETHLAPGSFPAWSPNGTRIVFTSTAGISVMNDDGSDIVLLLRHDFLRLPLWDMGVAKPAWSPDGAHIAFEHRGDGGNMLPAQIYVMKADGSNPRRVTPDHGGQNAESDPSWSPDGAQLAFWSYGYGIATVSATGGEPGSLYRDFPAISYGARPSWTPDGRFIVFTAAAGGVWSVAAVPGGGIIRLLVGGSEAVWHPDGTRIAFVSSGGGQ